MRAYGGAHFCAASRASVRPKSAKFSRRCWACTSSKLAIRATSPGRFNSHMISLLMLHADEGFWAGDKKAEGKLKDLVTGKKLPIEYKGKESFWINNYVRLLVGGNPDWQVPAAFEERRFATLDMGDAHREDFPYFAAI